jgi:FkbM family methyltransferase
MKFSKKASILADRLSNSINRIPGLTGILLKLIRGYALNNDLTSKEIKILSFMIRMIIRGQGKAIIRTPSGLFFNAFDQSQYVNQVLLLKGTNMDYCWEPNGSRLLIDLIKPDDRIVVAGANIGFETIIIGNNLKSGNGICYAFEPIKENYKILKENIRLNKLELKIKTFPFALSNIDCESRMLSAGPNSSLLYLNEGDKLQKVLVRRLDTLWNEGKIDLISGLIADVEGNEWEIISGAEELLSISPIRFMFFEINKKTEEVTPGKIKNMLFYLLDKKYYLFAVPDDYRGFQKLSSIKKKLICIMDPENPFVLPNRWFNVLAVKEQVLVELPSWIMCK